jgi:hypothetical protein
MSMDARDISYFIAISRRVVELIDATTIAITDVPVGLTRNEIAALVDRAYAGEQPKLGAARALGQT